MSSLVDAARSDPRAGQFSTSHLAVRGRYQSLLWVSSGLSPGAATGQKQTLGQSYLCAEPQSSRTRQREKAGCLAMNIHASYTRPYRGFDT